MRKQGCIEPVIYFVNGNDSRHPVGYILMSPYTGCPTPSGYTCEAAETLSEVDKLERKLQMQDRIEREQEYIRDWSLMERRNQEIRNSLYAKMTSGDTSQYEKDFIREWMKLKDEQKKKKYEQRFLEYKSFLWARHNDIGNRKADEEVFHPDRIEVK